MASISIVLKAIDQYSGVITGLNQGFELVGKGIDALKASADFAFTAIANGVELVTKGGNFREQESQLRFLAEAYSQNSNSIVASIKDISDNTVNLSDAMKITAKAIVTGLSGPEIETTLKYVKKFSEATGASFTDLSEDVFKAFSTGKYSILKQMGVFVEKGTEATEVVKIFQSRLGIFGEAAFNAADNLEALTTAQDDFITKLGAAINDVPALQRALNFLTDTVVNFVNSFDSRPLTLFLEYAARILEAVYGAFTETFGDIGKYIFNVFKNLSTQSGFKEFALTTISILKDTIKFFVSWKDYIIDIFAVIADAAGSLIEIFGNAFSSIQILSIRFSNYIGSTIGGAFSSLFQKIQSLIINNPLLMDFPGVDILLEKLSKFQYELVQTEKISRQQLKDAETKGFFKDIENFGKGLQESAMNFSSSSSDSIDRFAKAAEKAINGVKFPDYKELDIGTKRTKDQLDAIRKLVDAQKNLDEDDTKTTKKNKQKQKEIKDEEKKLKTLKDISRAQKDIENNQDNAARRPAQQTGGLVGDTRTFFSPQDLKNWLDKDWAKQKADLLKKGNVVVEQSIFPEKKTETSTDKYLRELVELQKDQITPQIPTNKTFEEEITEYLSKINWPEELRALGEFLLGFILAKARNERIPLTISTF